MMLKCVIAFVYPDKIHCMHVVQAIYLTMLKDPQPFEDARRLIDSLLS